MSTEKNDVKSVIPETSEITNTNELPKEGVLDETELAENLFCFETGGLTTCLDIPKVV